MPKYCSSALCKNNAKDHPTKKFALFVQAQGRNPDLQRAQRWIHLMGRLNFSVENIRRHTYVCEDHFDEEVDLDYRTVILIKPNYFKKQCSSSSFLMI